MALNDSTPTPDRAHSDRDLLLMDAISHLRAVILALQYANEISLRDKAFTLTNDVLHARQVKG